MPRYRFNDWSPLDTKQLDTFASKLDTLAKQTFGIDQDGDCPVSVRVLDRSRYEPMHWWVVPYEHTAKTAEEMERIEQALLSNLDTALDALQRFRAMHQRKRT
jgi:hypothetical protein